MDFFVRQTVRGGGLQERCSDGTMVQKVALERNFGDAERIRGG
jgi:hypothetical protein